MSVATSLAEAASPAALMAAVRRTPLAGRTVTVSAPEGSTVAQFVAMAFPDAENRRFVVVEIDGIELLPTAWARVTPKAGQAINLVLRPGGDFVRTVLQIAVIAVAAWVAGPAGVAAFGNVGAAVAAAGVTIAGNLLINALVPLPGANSGQQDRPGPFYAVTGARNRANPWGRVPMLFGKHRIVPQLYGQVVQETVGGKPYIRVPLLLGVCPMQVSDWKIGETALSAFAGVELETRLTESAPAHTLYTGDPAPASVGVQLTTASTTRTTVANVDEIEVTFAFRSGLGGYDSKQRKVAKTVGLNIEYRPTGSSDPWTTYRASVPQANTASANAGVAYRPNLFSTVSWVTYRAQLQALSSVPNGAHSVTRADPGAGFLESVRFAVPRGQYDVRISRTLAESSDPNTVDAVHWETLNSIKSDVEPFPNRKLASAVLRIPSGPETNGVIEQINCIAEQLAPTFSSGALSDPDSADAADLTGEVATRNPAYLGLACLRGAQNAMPKPDAEIDWPSWADAAARWAASGVTFDEYVESNIGRWEMLRRILAAGHARPVKFHGRVGVVIDRDRTGEPPSQVFTARSIRGLRSTKTFPRPVHAVRVGFANEANGYQADEVTVYLPGYDDTNATIYETLALPGHTNADRIRTAVNQYVRNAHFMTESMQFEIDAESLTVSRGAYTLLQHDVMVVGLGAGVVKSLQMSGGNVSGFTLDVGINTVAGPTLGARWRKVKNASGVGYIDVEAEVAVTRDSGDTRIFTFGSPRAPASAPAVGDMVTIGETGQVALPVLVQEIAPRANFEATVTVIPYAGERFVTTPTWPAHNPMTTIPLGRRPATPVLLSMRVTDQAMTLTFKQPQSPRGVVIDGYETFVREKGTTADAWEARATLPADQNIFIAPVGAPGTPYDLRIIAVGHDSGGITVRSLPLDVLNQTAVDAPSQPTGCAASFATRTSSAGAQQLVLTATWTPNENSDVLDTVVEMLVSTGPDVWAEIGRGRAALGRIEIHGLQVGRSYNLGFTHLSKRGAPSIRTTIASVTAPDTLTATGVRPGGVDITAFASSIRPVELVSSNPVSGNTVGRTVYNTTDGKLYQYGSGGTWSEVAGGVADGSLTLAKFASGIRPIEIVSSLPATGNVEGRLVYLTTDDKIYRYTGSAWTTAIAAGDISGQLADAQIAALAASKVTGQLTNAQLADIAAAKITGTIASTQIADNAITTPKINAAAITTAKLAADAVTANEIAANAVTAAKINAGAVTTAKLAAGAVTANEIAANAIIAGKIAANAISSNELQANSVIAGKIAAAAVSTTELAASAVTADKIAAGQVTTAKLAAGAVTANELAANAIVAGKIAAGAVNTAELAAGAVTAGKIAVASLDAISATIGLLRTAASGARMEIESNVLRVYDTGGLRVKLGNLA